MGIQFRPFSRGISNTICAQEIKGEIPQQLAFRELGSVGCLFPSGSNYLGAQCTFHRLIILGTLLAALSSAA